MKKVTVTSELRKVLNSLNLGTGRFVFSDSRKVKGEKAVGVKFSGLKLTEEQEKKVISEMESRGFKYHYSRFNAGGYGGWSTVFNGMRFCFSKIN